MIAPRPKSQHPWRLPERNAVTIIAGFMCQGGIVICADTQETFGTAKRNVPKLQCFKGPVSNQDHSGMINHDLALAICGAGDGPFIDKIASQAWDSVRYVSDVQEAAEHIESMIKETYRELGQIYQAGACPYAELIYGITVAGQSALYQATGPIVNERSYASSGMGYYLADFLTSKMRGSGWLTIRQSVILAAYILFHAKEHVEGCGGASHIAVLRDSESSGMVDFRLIGHLDEYMMLADRYTGEMLLTAADFSISNDEVSKEIDQSVSLLKYLRDREMERMKNDRQLDEYANLFGFDIVHDDLGLPISVKPSTSHRAEDQ